MRAKNIIQNGITLALSLLIWSPAHAATSQAKPAAKPGAAKSGATKPAAAKPAPPKTAQDFAAQYMSAFNKKDGAGLNKLRYQPTVKSPMQEMIDEMTAAEMNAGTQFTKFEILSIDEKRPAGGMGLDGMFYEPNLKPTNLLKLSSVTKNGSSSTTFPIGVKDGVFYQVAMVKAEGAQPAYNFGWQRFSAPKSNWSVFMPNEPEPGKAALEKEAGQSAMEDPDVYGVVRNTASIKTTQHFFRCGAEGKRVNATDNKETYRAARTTYEPETLKEWFNDPKKTLDDTVDLRVRSLPGTLIVKKDIEMNGSPGREFEIKGENGSFLLGRVYWIKDALYELTFETTESKPNVLGANKFISSLEVK